jgi:predicted molibdopterin-dependent oxidoreductase YjgC
VKLLAPDAKPWADFLTGVGGGSIRHAIALGAITPDAEGDASKLEKLEALVVVAAHESALTKAASVVLPATSWAEQHGTYVNKQGHKQKAEKAIEPQGTSRQALLFIADLATALGHEPTWKKYKDVAAKLDVTPPTTQVVVLPTTATQAV